MLAQISPHRAEQIGARRMEHANQDREAEHQSNADAHRFSVWPGQPIRDHADDDHGEERQDPRQSDRLDFAVSRQIVRVGAPLNQGRVVSLEPPPHALNLARNDLQWNAPAVEMGG